MCMLCVISTDSLVHAKIHYEIERDQLVNVDGGQRASLRSDQLGSKVVGEAGDGIEASDQTISEQRCQDTEQ